VSDPQPQNPTEEVADTAFDDLLMDCDDPADSETDEKIDRATPDTQTHPSPTIIQRARTAIEQFFT
jgi:hypothetical protein